MNATRLGSTTQANIWTAQTEPSTRGKAPGRNTRAQRPIDRLSRSTINNVESSRNSKHLDSALSKMGAMFNALGTSASLDSAMAHVMHERSKRTNDVLKSAQGSIKDKFDKLRQQTIEQRKAVERRRQAQKSKSWWQSLVTFVKKAFDYGSALLTIASSVASGNAVGAVSGTLTLSSLLVRDFGADNSTTMWTSMGLAAGGGIVGSFSKGETATIPSQVKEGVVEGVSVGADLAAAHYNRKADYASADILDIKAEKKRLWQAIEDEQELIKDFVEAQTRTFNAIARILKTDSDNLNLAQASA
jgi:cysteinyl-tRNA synthetase